MSFKTAAAIAMISFVTSPHCISHTFETDTAIKDPRMSSNKNILWISTIF
jgi:hypothetical protein